VAGSHFVSVRLFGLEFGRPNRLALRVGWADVPLPHSNCHAEGAEARSTEHNFRFSLGVCFRF